MTPCSEQSVEAAAGYIVTQIQGLLASSLQFLPNLVLINAGVNDCTYNVDIPNIGTRMNSLLDDVYNNIPGVTVLLSTLLPSLDATADECHASVNAQYRSLVTTRISQGYKIRLAECENMPLRVSQYERSSAVCSLAECPCFSRTRQLVLVHEHWL